MLIESKIKIGHDSMFNIRQARFKSAHLLNKMALVQSQRNRSVRKQKKEKMKLNSAVPQNIESYKYKTVSYLLHRIRIKLGGIRNYLVLGEECLSHLIQQGTEWVHFSCVEFQKCREFIACTKADKPVEAANADCAHGFLQ